MLRDSGYNDYQLSEAQSKFSDGFFTSKRHCCLGQIVTSNSNQAIAGKHVSDGHCSLT